MLNKLIIIAGIGQLLLVLASAAIPACLGWKQHLTSLPNLMRQLFWTYAGYLLGMHLLFALLSMFGSRLLLDGTPLAIIFCGLMALWWTVRIVLQIICFDRSCIATNRFNQWAEVALMLLFIGLSITYLWAVYHNFTQ